MPHSNDLFQLLLSGSSVTLVPTTANRLPMEPYSVLMEQLWAKGIDISAFLIPEQELADLYRKNPSWRPNNIEIARNDLFTQLPENNGEDLTATDEEGGDDGGGQEARFEPKGSQKSPRVSVLDEIEKKQKPRPKPAPSAQESLIEPIKRRIGSKPRTHDEGRELEMD